MVQIHEVNQRIIDEIKKHKTDDKLKQFLLDILDFELEHFDERTVRPRIRFREDYEHIINKCCHGLGE